MDDGSAQVKPPEAAGEPGRNFACQAVGHRL